MVHALVWILFGLLTIWTVIFAVLAVRPTAPRVQEQDHVVFVRSSSSRSVVKAAVAKHPVSSETRPHVGQPGDVEPISAL